MGFRAIELVKTKVIAWVKQLGKSLQELPLIEKFRKLENSMN